jgi:hypothetical protein
MTTPYRELTSTFSASSINYREEVVFRSFVFFSILLIAYSFV